MSKMAKITIIIGIMVLSLVLATACGGGAPAPASSPAPAASPAPAPSGGGGGAFPLEVTPILEGHAQGIVSTTVTTLPGAVCTIKVTNPKTGTVSSRPVEKTKTADANGKVVWEWDIPRQVAKGDGTLEVTAEKDGKKVTKTVVYRITVSDY
ncbi:MAG: hypothetical protein AB1597_07070 [Chloroflexota bacterium]